MKKILDTTIRILVGGLFIFSGLIKLNDPIGTKIKLKEYFEVFSSDFGSVFELLIPFALPIGFILIVLEVILGIAVLINFKMRQTSIALLVMIVFFSFLTFYSAYFDKVTDCGCFGDAIKLTPWESFIKDVILFVLILHLFWYRNSYTPMFLKRTSWAIMIAATGLSVYLGIYVLNHLPIIDFRAYKIGNNLPELMEPKEQAVTEYTFEKDGKEITSLEWKDKKEGYEYKSSRILNEDKIIPLLTDYYVSDANGNEVTLETFKGAKLIVVVQEREGNGIASLEAINALTTGLEAVLEPMILTSILEKDIETLRHTYQMAIPYYFVDATVLKAIVRSNPGVLLLQQGTVLGKWHYNDVPSKEEIVNLLVNAQ